MSKIKMRCNTCGKWFQSANAKEITCPDCVQKARKEKLAAKNAPPATNKGATASNQPKVVAPPPKPKTEHRGTNQWLDSLEDVKIAEPEPPPPPRPKTYPPAPPREKQRTPEEVRAQSTIPEQQREDEQRRENLQRGPGGYRDDGGRRGPNGGPGNYQPNRPGGFRPGGPGNFRPGGPDQASGPGGKPRFPMDNRAPRGPRPAGPPGAEGSHPQYKPKPRPKGHGKPPAPPKPKREKIPPPEPFTPTEEQITLVENRYIELATPAEFDGIRTQIAQELGIPKKAIKKIIKDLRDKQHIPSWWEVQTYKGSNEDLERIRAAYLPFLPVPQVGVHKKIADELDLKPGVIYQAIKTIRLEMNLPQYNDPTFHEEELAAIREQRALQRKQQEEAHRAKTARPEEQLIPEEKPEQENEGEGHTEGEEHNEEKVLSESAVGSGETTNEQNETAQ
jgi:hypothetical protein